MTALCSESVLGGIDVGDPASPRGSNRAGAPADSLSSDKQQSSSSSDSSSTAEEKLKLLAEELVVERRQVETGRVRVDVVTREHQELVDILLAREQVVVERVPIDRRVDAIPTIREEGDTIIVPVVEEILIVERRLILKEELHVKRVRTTEQHRESIMLRRQEAVVTRTPKGTPDVGPDPAKGGKA
jgi:uncharacterized protein (TIGR02271 family)